MRLVWLMALISDSKATAHRTCLCCKHIKIEWLGYSLLSCSKTMPDDSFPVCALRHLQHASTRWHCWWINYRARNDSVRNRCAHKCKCTRYKSNTEHRKTHICSISNKFRLWIFTKPPFNTYNWFITWHARIISFDSTFSHKIWKSLEKFNGFELRMQQSRQMVQFCINLRTASDDSTGFVRETDATHSNLLRMIRSFHASI